MESPIRVVVVETRGAGLIGPTALVGDKKIKASFDSARDLDAHWVARCEGNGLIERGVGGIIVYRPPLVITVDQVHDLLDTFAKSLGETLDWVCAG